MRSSPRHGTTGPDPRTANPDLGTEDLWAPAYDPGRIAAPAGSGRPVWDPPDPPTDPAFPVVPAVEPHIPQPRGHRHDELPDYPVDRSAFVAGRTTEIPAVRPGGPEGTGWEYGSWAGRSWERPGQDAAGGDHSGRDTRRDDTAGHDPVGNDTAGYHAADRDGAHHYDAHHYGAYDDDPAFVDDYRDLDHDDLDHDDLDHDDLRYDDLRYDPRYDEEPAGGDLRPTSRARLAALAVPVAVGIAVSVGLGVYARVHEPTGVAINVAGFSSGVAAKSGLTALAFAFGLVQLVTALRMSGRVGRGAGRGTFLAHRWSGRIAVLVSLPVAAHCLYALGYSDTTPRVLVHSLLGCFFYGAFAAKMLVLRRRTAPAWALPVLGGLVFVLLTGLFLTSAAWYFATYGPTL